MRVLNCALGFIGLMAMLSEAAVVSKSRVRGQAEESGPTRKNRRLMATGVGGGFNDDGTTSGRGSGGTSVTNPTGGNTDPTVGGGRAESKKGKGSKGGGRSIKGSQGGFRGGDDEGVTEICTCMSCTVDVLNTMAGNFSCGQRIDFLLRNNSQAFPTTATACRQVAALEFPDECGACDPFSCDGRTEPETSDTRCGCQTCNAEAWNLDAGGYTCGARISWAMIVDQAQEEDACRLITKMYPQCAPCNPETCLVPATAAPSIAGRSEPTPAPFTPAPVSVAPVSAAPVPAPLPAIPAPTSAAPILDTMAPVSSAPTSGRSEPSADTTPRPTPAPQTAAPQTAAPQSLPPVEPQTTAAPTKECPEYCNCWSCADAWMNDAGGLTCGQRINWLIGTNIGEEAACRAVGGMEFPEACGACNPDTCDGRSEPFSGPVPMPVAMPVAAPFSTTAPTGSRAEPVSTPAPSATAVQPTTANPTVKEGTAVMTPAPTTARPVQATTPAPTAAVMTQAPTTARPVQATTPAPTLPAVSTGAPAMDTSAPTSGRAGPTASFPTTTSDDLYCFPPSSQRRRYTEMWSDYTVEAKDSGDDVCGPVNNAFADVLVNVDESKEMSLNFRYVNGRWYGSEARILRDSGYSYGTFTYNIKEIRVIENNTIVDNVLPAGLVLGMFTWDPTYNNGQSEIYEIDIEVSRFGVASNADCQFLLQPPVAPHYYRFNTGTNGNYDQAPQKYEFTWLPTSIAWYSTAGGGQNLLYTSAQAVASGDTDRVQCIPDGIEARIGLWSIRSAGAAPDGMSQNQQVQVIVDSFVFTPIDVTGVADGEICTKNCQCLSGYCENSVCTSQ